ncbi:MAG: thiol reductant ABC exporter subunit CydD [Bacillota bacterium]|nr:thiol reductant ABC exporter subunit CydD [Bacillota bacterium]
MGVDRRLIARVRPVRHLLGMVVVLGLLAGLLAVAQASLLAGVVDRVLLRGAGLPALERPAAALLAVMLARALLAWGSELAAFELAARVRQELRERLARHLLALGPARAAGERSGELVNTLLEGVEQLETYLGRYLPQLALAALVPLVLVAFVFPRDWLSGVIFLVTLPLLPFFMWLIGGQASLAARRRWAELARLSAHFLDVVQGLPTLKLFGLGKREAEVVARASDRFRGATMATLRVAFLSALALELLASLSTAVVAVALALRLLGGGLSFREAFFVLLLAPEIYQPLRTLGSQFHASTTGAAASRRIFELLEQPAPWPEEEVAVAGERRDPAAPAPRGPAERGLRSEGVRFEAVAFTYPGAERPAVAGLSFAVEPGERVALVGPTGAGKSTVLALWMGFLRPEAGGVRVGGRRLEEVGVAAWRAQVALVPQQPYLFAGSVAENLRLARPGAGEAELWEALRAAGAEEFVRALPFGLETRLGEEGAGLSGGERQRLAIARAWLRGAPWLVMDEPTAHLDPESEAAVQEALARLLAGRGALVVAHRLATIRQLDRILVLDRGRLVEEGSHEALVARGGLYARLARAYVGPAAGAAARGEG